MLMLTISFIVGLTAGVPLAAWLHTQRLAREGLAVYKRREMKGRSPRGIVVGAAMEPTAATDPGQVAQ